jgi:hypothetical protein
LARVWFRPNSRTERLSAFFASTASIISTSWLQSTALCVTSCTIPPPPRAPRSEEGGLCSCGLTAHDHLPHLKDSTQFQDLGADHFDRRSKEVRAKRLVTQLAKLGFLMGVTDRGQCHELYAIHPARMMRKIIPPGS